MQDLLIFVSEQWYLFTALFVILILMVFTGKSKQIEIDVPSAVKLINNHNVKLFDVRNSNDYANSHIIGAENKKLSEIDFEKIKYDYLIIYANESIQLSNQVQQKLKNIKNSTTKIYVLKMGIGEWINQELPTVKGKNANLNKK